MIFKTILTNQLLCSEGDLSATIDKVVRNYFFLFDPKRKAYADIKALCNKLRDLSLRNLSMRRNEKLLNSLTFFLEFYFCFSSNVSCFKRNVIDKIVKILFSLKYSSLLQLDNQHPEIIYCKSTVDLGERFLQSLQWQTMSEVSSELYNLLADRDVPY